MSTEGDSRKLKVQSLIICLPKNHDSSIHELALLVTMESDLNLMSFVYHINHGMQDKPEAMEMRETSSCVLTCSVGKRVLIYSTALKSA